jgi:hypothetical protein
MAAYVVLEAGLALVLALALVGLLTLAFTGVRREDRPSRGQRRGDA